MRSLFGLLSGAIFALCANAASAQDLAIDVEQSFTAHPERFGLSSLPEPQAQVAIPPAQAEANAHDETPPVGEGAREDAREQGDGEAATWEDEKEDEAAH
ncbi:MAG: hypothetical protein ACT4OF_14575 [Caulobacteraceae bacterium]